MSNPRNFTGSQPKGCSASIVSRVSRGCSPAQHRLQATWTTRLAVGSAFCAGLMLAGCQTDTGDDLTPITPPPGDRPPIVTITEPLNDITVEAGEKVTIRFVGEDAESTARVTVLVDPDRTPNNNNEIVLKNDFFVGPGRGSGQFVWDTTGVTAATYVPFAKINDGVNPEVIVAGTASVQVVPKGTNPLPIPPAFQFVGEFTSSDLGLASGDLVTLRYRYRDADSPVRITLLLDKDQIPTNDDINNPGDPNAEDTNIILLPSGPRQFGDPTLPSSDPNVPPLQDDDNVRIRENPRDYASTPTGAFSEDKAYVFNIDFSRIPVRQDGLPYFIRATITDDVNPPVHEYATGRLTISGLAQGFTDLRTVGVTIAGARWQGFSSHEQLGTGVSNAGDGDNDGVQDFVMIGRFGSPRNRLQSGVGYLVRGRRKTPVPNNDENTNGLPDQRDTNSQIVDFPRPPLFISPPPVFNPQNPTFPIPYQPQFAGRFGGLISVNSLGSFYRGVIIQMPMPHNAGTVPEALIDPTVPNQATGGLTSVTQLQCVGDDAVPDLIFGLPYIAQYSEWYDSDPCNGMGTYSDGYPYPPCNGAIYDPIQPRGIPSGTPPINGGMIILLSGANDTENDGTANGGRDANENAAGFNNAQGMPDGYRFRVVMDAGMAGQCATGFLIEDDEGVIHSRQTTPLGMRMRGGWLQGNQDPPIVEDNEFGSEVSRLPSFDNDFTDELLISIPNHDNSKGRVDLFLGQNLANGGFYGTSGVRSYPDFVCAGTDGAVCFRVFPLSPNFVQIIGANNGDRLGGARPGGQFNQDGIGDIICGAPGASRDNLTRNGVVYILLSPAGGFGDTDLGASDVPRVEIHGIHNDDQFGHVQNVAGDLNGDSVEDVLFASQNYRDDGQGNDRAGYVGVIFGNRPITGEKVFFPEQVGTAQLSGVRFYGATVGARAGAAASGAGDFNQDGFGDIVISAPGEVRIVNGENRLGVAYLVFGGTHLIDKSFNLSQVGSPTLPGIVFVSPYVLGSAEEATIEFVAGIGDIDADGFADLALGLPRADFVYPPQPNQRRIDAGECYIVYGSNFGTNRLPETNP